MDFLNSIFGWKEQRIRKTSILGWKEKRNDKRAQFCYGRKEKVNEFYLFNFLMESKNECFIQSFEWKQKKSVKLFIQFLDI